MVTNNNFMEHSKNVNFFVLRPLVPEILGLVARIAKIYQSEWTKIKF
jgi:hypothetical protein